MSYRSSTNFRNKRSYPFSSSSSFKRPYNTGFTPRFRGRYEDQVKLPHIDWEIEKLSEFKRNFYKEHPSVKNREPEAVSKILKDLEIKTSVNAPNPITSFTESGLPNYILKTIGSLDFKTPTPIQSQSFPIALSGNDMVGIASTGSGKTLAFLIPGIIHINAQSPVRRGDGPIALVLVPTRELAIQIQQQIPPFSKEAKLTHTAVYGGASRKPQEMDLRHGVDIVVATPGRLLDFLGSRVTNLKRTTYLVLDEADRMLDMGFEKPIRRILSQIRPDRQTLLFSATWPKEIQALSADFLNDPVHVNIGSMGLSACKNVQQKFEVVDENNKLLRLLFFLRELSPKSKVLIFVATKISTDSLRDNLRSNGFSCDSINGDKRQNERDMVLSRFKNGATNILVATDVASRGIDVKDISAVVNFDFPGTIEDYVHRIGRTGRAERKGTSYTLLTTNNAPRVRQLVELLRNDKLEVPQELEELVENYGARRGRNNSNGFNSFGGYRGGYRR